MHGQWPSHYYSIGMFSHCWLTGYRQAIVTHYSQQIFIIIIIILNGPFLDFSVSESNDIKGANSPRLPFLFFFFLSSAELTSTVSSYFFLLLIFTASIKPTFPLLRALEFLMIIVLFLKKIKRKKRLCFSSAFGHILEKMPLCQQVVDYFGVGHDINTQGGK